MADGTDGGFGGSIHGSDDEPYQTPEAQVYALANKIKRMVDEEYHFVFFWGMPQAGKTHILYTIWLCLEQLGSVVDNEGDKATVRRQKAFRFALDEFCKCKPGKGTLLPDIFEITAVFSPKIAIKGSFPAIKFAFIEASGEITARQHTMDKMLGGQELDFPPLHNAILSEENAKVLHVLVPAYQLGQSFKDQQDANLNEVLSLLEKKRPR
ncbi:MAG: hypothetical protein RL748_1356, partial [Pseudomonadota bacterium]